MMRKAAQSAPQELLQRPLSLTGTFAVNRRFLTAIRRQLMFGMGSRSSTHDIAQRLETLRHDVALLGEALADAAEETTRGPRKNARRYAHDTVEGLTAHAEELGSQAGALARSGLSAAIKGQRQLRSEFDEAAERTQDLVVRHPGPALFAALGVGLVAALVLSLVVQKPHRQGGSSRGGIVRRPSAKTR